MTGRRGGRPEVVVSAGEAAAIIEACTAGGMSKVDAAARFGHGRRTIARVLREQGGLLPPAEASLLAGIRPGRLRALAVTGAIRRVSCSGTGRYLYFRDDMLALAAAERHTAALRWAWDGVYQVTATADGLEAWRTDGTGSVAAATPEGLRDAIAEDWPKYAEGTAP